MKPLSFIIVGSGWRSLFFVRIAKQYPEQFELKYMLCRTEEKTARMAGENQIPTTTSVEACVEAKPDFVVVAVSKPSLFEETKKWAQLGFPVLCETPAAGSVEDLIALWELVQGGAKFQIAEQYHRYPVLAAGLKAVKQGRLADPYAVTLSMAHEYHGISLIRRMLQPDDPMKLQLQSVVGEKYAFPVTDTDSRAGAITDGSVQMRDRARVTLRFVTQAQHTSCLQQDKHWLQPQQSLSNPEQLQQQQQHQPPQQPPHPPQCCPQASPVSKVAFYDFSGAQYHSYIRACHVNVQGRDGEWNDTFLRYVGEDHLPQVEQLKAYFAPEHAQLVTSQLKQQSVDWLPYIDMSNAQDEYAIATMMYDMREYIAGGKEVYPMAEALEDAYLTLLMKQALEHPGQEILPKKMPWQNA